jgi:hypothetical protein
MRPQAGVGKLKHAPPFPGVRHRNESIDGWFCIRARLEACRNTSIANGFSLCAFLEFAAGAEAVP